MFGRKKKDEKTKYYRTLGWQWGGLFVYPIGYSMRAVTEYNPDDTYELFCHDVYGVHPRFVGGYPPPVYYSPFIALGLLIAALLGESTTFFIIFDIGWALFVWFANWYLTSCERSKYE